MRHGLIAQWHRQMAANGALGVALLAIPVVVAATIGFGGTGGLASLAAGPGEGALGQSSVERVRGDRRLGELAEALPAAGARTVEEVDQPAAAVPEVVGTGAIPGGGDETGVPAPDGAALAGPSPTLEPAPATVPGDEPFVAPGDGEPATDPGAENAPTVLTDPPTTPGGLVDVLLGGLTGTGP